MASPSGPHGPANGKHPVGRPSIYSAALADDICRRLAEGQSLREIARDPAMPNDVTVRRWLRDGKHDQFCRQYAEAREQQADRMFEEMLDIADDGSNDWIARNKFDGDTALLCDHEQVNRSRLRVDTRKWILARMSPKKYGEKTAVEHSGEVALTLLDSMRLTVGRRRAPALAVTGNGHGPRDA